ncbi:E3 ubiquitin-protein ligase RAD18-like isoform X2 [Tachypleus tridentatus]|uniref:E3 ubiquitin-protein ligase RAD18-like isoform X2 n=1 Tax=Tachypleus tridentatus TaxID=6853 RepID=UPI003FD008E3
MRKMEQEIQNLSSILNPTLKSLDQSLRCTICFEYFNVCMITVCSHNYCSLCIRKYMTYKSQCPTCFEETSEPELRNNRIVDDFLKHYFRLIETLRKFLRLEEQNLQELGRKIKVSNDDQSNSFCRVPEEKGLLERSGIVCEDSVLMSSAKAFLPSKTITSPTDADVISNKEASTSGESKSEITDKSALSHKVACPVCSVPVPIENINIHLDKCLSREREENLEKTTNEKKRQPLPKLVYHLLSDKILKKKMKAVGLSTQGNRQCLIKRHKAFVILYNAECDAVQPQSVSEIIQQVEKEEKEIKSVATKTSIFQYDKKSSPSVIENEQTKYVKQHERQFQQLTEDIQRRQEKKKHLSCLKNEISTGNFQEDDNHQMEINRTSNDSDSTLSDCANSSTHMYHASSVHLSDLEYWNVDNPHGTDRKKGLKIREDKLEEDSVMETVGGNEVKGGGTYNIKEEFDSCMREEKVKDIWSKHEPTSSCSKPVKHIPLPVRGKLSTVKQNQRLMKRQGENGESSEVMLHKRCR